MEKASRDTVLVPLALLLTALPYAAAFYHNTLLCDKDPVACVAYERKYHVEQRNFDLNGTIEHGMLKLEKLVQTYTQ